MNNTRENVRIENGLTSKWVQGELLVEKAKGGGKH